MSEEEEEVIYWTRGVVTVRPYITYWNTTTLDLFRVTVYLDLIYTFSAVENSYNIGFDLGNVKPRDGYNRCNAPIIEIYTLIDGKWTLKLTRKVEMKTLKYDSTSIIGYTVKPTLPTRVKIYKSYAINYSSASPLSTNLTHDFIFDPEKRSFTFIKGTEETDHYRPYVPLPDLIDEFNALPEVTIEHYGFKWIWIKKNEDGSYYAGAEVTSTQLGFDGQRKVFMLYHEPNTDVYSLESDWQFVSGSIENCRSSNYSGTAFAQQLLFSKDLKVTIRKPVEYDYFGWVSHATLATTSSNIYYRHKDYPRFKYPIASLVDDVLNYAWYVDYKGNMYYGDYFLDNLDNDSYGARHTSLNICPDTPVGETIDRPYGTTDNDLQPNYFYNLFNRVFSDSFYGSLRVGERCSHLSDPSDPTSGIHHVYSYMNVGQLSVTDHSGNNVVLNNTVWKFHGTYLYYASAIELTPYPNQSWSIGVKRAKWDAELLAWIEDYEYTLSQETNDYKLDSSNVGTLEIYGDSFVFTGIYRNAYSNSSQADSLALYNPKVVLKSDDTWSAANRTDYSLAQNYNGMSISDPQYRIWILSETTLYNATNPIYSRYQPTSKYALVGVGKFKEDIEEESDEEIPWLRMKQRDDGRGLWYNARIIESGTAVKSSKDIRIGENRL